MATSYSLTITMDQATVDFLAGGKYSLYAFKGAQGGGSGVPLVWFQTTQFALNTQINWQEQYAGYTTLTQAEAGAIITASSSYPMNLGERLDITSATGVGTVVVGSTPGAIEFLNTPGALMTCGIAQMVNNVSTPICAFPIAAGMDVIAPVEQVVVLFSTQQLNTGAVIEQSYSPALLVDLTAQNSRSVAYDMTAGWTQEVGTTPIPAGTSLLPFLIGVSPVLKAIREKSLASAAKPALKEAVA